MEVIVTDFFKKEDVLVDEAGVFQSMPLCAAQIRGILELGPESTKRMLEVFANLALYGIKAKEDDLWEDEKKIYGMVAPAIASWRELKLLKGIEDSDTVDALNQEHAYSKYNPYKAATDEYIGRYLDYKSHTLQISNNAPNLVITRSPLIQWEDVAVAIKSMSYDSFLHTGYWKTISHHVKQAANYKCSMCGQKFKEHQLAAHHRSYSRHGYEALYWKWDLACVCHECHRKIHEKDKVISTEE